MEDTTNSLLLQLKSPPVIGCLLMLAIFINILLIIWCTKAYEDPYFVLDTQMKLNALWRDYTPCGILAMWSGRRPRGWTSGEALHALNQRRAVNRQAEAEALALARAKYREPQPKPTPTDKPEGALRVINKTNKVTKQRAIQKAKKINTSQKNVGFLIDDYAKTKEFPGGIAKLQKRNNKVHASTSTYDDARELGDTVCKRTSFRKIDLRYKRPPPPLPVSTFEDRTAKIVIPDVFDRYAVPKSDSNPGPSHRYEYLETSSRGGVPVRLQPQPHDSSEPVGPEPIPFTDELEVIV